MSLILITLQFNLDYVIVIGGCSISFELQMGLETSIRNMYLILQRFKIAFALRVQITFVALELGACLN